MAIELQPNLLRAALHCAGKRDIRSYLNGVHVNIGANGVARYESTDGHIGFAGVGSKMRNPQAKLILERDSLEKALRAIGRKVDMVALTDVTGTSARLGGYPVEVLNARFPDMDNVLNGKLDPVPWTAFNPALLGRIMASAGELAGKHPVISIVGRTAGGALHVAQQTSFTSALWVVMMIADKARADTRESVLHAHQADAVAEAA